MIALLRGVLLCACVARALTAQPTATIDLIGPHNERAVVRAAELSAMSRHEIAAQAHHVSGRYAGVALGDVLRRLSLPRGDSLRGAALATYVLIEAADAYRALFALAEIDSAFTDRVILLADRKDGAPLDAKNGPFQLIVPGEKRPARWVRQVRRIRVVHVPVGAP